MALIFRADTFRGLRKCPRGDQFWGFELLNDGYLQQAETTDHFRCRTGVASPIRALKLRDTNEIRHSDQVSSRRRNCRSEHSGGTCDADDVATCQVSVDILASLVWHSVKAVLFQTQISRTKHGYYTEDPPLPEVSFILCPQVEAHLTLIKQQARILFEGCSSQSAFVSSVSNAFVSTFWHETKQDAG